MRLIDKDLCKADIEQFNRPLCDDYHMKDYVLNQIITDIENQPTVDAVPVIRCRDCKYSYGTLPTVYRYLMCSHGVCVDCIVDEDFYCAMAERKEE